MSMTKTAARQSPIAAVFNIGFADPTAYGTFETPMEVPANAIVVGGDIAVTTAWNSATSAALSIGDAALATRYANAVDLKTAARTALTLTGYKHTVQEFLRFLAVQAGAAATAGAARVTLLYLVDGKADSGQGLGV